MPLGKGTRLQVQPDMLEVWQDLADRFSGYSFRKTQHTPHLHVTLQNKVTSRGAKALQRGAYRFR